MSSASARSPTHISSTRSSAYRMRVRTGSDSNASRLDSRVASSAEIPRSWARATRSASTGCACCNTMTCLQTSVRPYGCPRQRAVPPGHSPLTSGVSATGDGAAAFEQHDIPPAAAQLPWPLPHAQHPEAGGPVQREARLVLREDAGLDRPDPGVLGRLDQGGEQPATDAAAAGRLGDVHGVLDDAGVDAPAGDRRDRGPADDGSVDLGDETVVGQ